MPNRLRATNKVRLDPLQALKRGFMHRGIVVGNQKRPKPSKIATKEISLSPDNSNYGDDSLELSKIDQAGQSRERVKIRAEETEDEADVGPQKLAETTEKAHDVLFQAETVFPFTLFPDHVTLDREKLTIAHRDFFKVAKIVTLPVVDILSVEADIGPFFGSVHTSSRYFVTAPHSVHFLWRSQAIALQRLLQGYIIAVEQNIDCSSIELHALKVLLTDLGQGAPD